MRIFAVIGLILMLVGFALRNVRNSAPRDNGSTQVGFQQVDHEVASMQKAADDLAAFQAKTDPLLREHDEAQAELDRAEQSGNPKAIAAARLKLGKVVDKMERVSKEVGIAPPARP